MIRGAASSALGTSLVAVLTAATPASAQESWGAAAGNEGFFVEVPVGMAMPVAETGYEGLWDPSVVLGVNVGYLFALSGWTATIGPELGASYSVGNVEDEWNRGHEDDLYLGRMRVLAAGRFLIAFGSAWFLARLGLGLDFVHASWDYDDGPNHREGDEADAGFGLLASIGMGYQIRDWIGIGLLLDIPMGFHDEDRAPPGETWDVEMVDFQPSFAVTFSL